MIRLLLAAVLSLIFCFLYRWLAEQRGWLAQPTARGSHYRATASGGGVAVMLAFALSLTPVASDLLREQRLLLLIALLLTAVGFADDRRSLPVTLRLCVYALASLAAAVALLQQGPAAAPWLIGAGALWFLVFTNFFNFMDGIDGLASLQCLSAALAAATLAHWTGVAPQLQLICLALAGAQLGFLSMNWPPARLFLGDAGSIPTGFLLAALAVSGGGDNLPLSCWAVLLAVFVSDAAFTLLLRARAGKPLTQAHRDHLYQRLARHWRSHRQVDIAFLLLQWCWLTPLAAWAALQPRYAPVPVLLAYATLIFIMVKYRRLQ